MISYIAQPQMPLSKKFGNRCSAFLCVPSHNKTRMGEEMKRVWVKESGDVVVGIWCNKYSNV
jgi:hypothetical protein